MIKLKHILSELLISEALPPSVAKQYLTIARSQKIKKRLSDMFDALSKLPNATTSKNGERVYIPFKPTNDTERTESTLEKEIRDLLVGTGYTLKDYVLGIAVDKYGRDVKLGKVLTKLGKDYALKKFRDDPSRQSPKNTNFVMAFSKHPYDIAGMSTDRGWDSCMNLYGGGNKRYIKWDIKAGSFICYLIKPWDTNINKPTGRVLIKPYINVTDKSDVVYSSDDLTYGTVPDSFRDEVQDIVNKIQGEKIGKFELVKSLYCNVQNLDNDYYDEPEDGRYIKNYKKATTKEEVEQMLSMIGIENYTINGDLTVDVEGSVYINEKSLSELPIKFGKVSGNFYIDSNNLKSLKGTPIEVKRSFVCSGNKITSLKGAPQKVGLDFLCDGNLLTSLEGAPKIVNGYFDCAENKITSLKGSPKKVGKHFDCSSNKLTSLEGSPEEVGLDFICDNNRLKSFEGAPKKIGREFRCIYNQPGLSEDQIDFIKNNINAQDFRFNQW